MSTVAEVNRAAVRRERALEGRLEAIERDWHRQLPLKFDGLVPGTFFPAYTLSETRERDLYVKCVSLLAPSSTGWVSLANDDTGAHSGAGRNAPLPQSMMYKPPPPPLPPDHEIDLSDSAPGAAAQRMAKSAAAESEDREGDDAFFLESSSEEGSQEGANSLTPAPVYRDVQREITAMKHRIAARRRGKLAESVRRHQWLRDVLKKIAQLRKKESLPKCVLRFLCVIYSCVANGDEINASVFFAVLQLALKDEDWKIPMVLTIVPEICHHLTITHETLVSWLKKQGVNPPQVNSTKPKSRKTRRDGAISLSRESNSIETGGTRGKNALSKPLSLSLSLSLDTSISLSRVFQDTVEHRFGSRI